MRIHLKPAVSALTAALLGLGVMASSAWAAGTIEAATADGATYTIPSEWVVGETLPVSGAGWTDIAGTAGSVIAIVYDFGSVPSNDPVDDEIWLRITANPDGSWSADLPFPADAGWTAGETHKVHLLTGSLGQNDTARGAAIDVELVEAANN